MLITRLASLSSVTYIDLALNKLTGAIPAAFCGMKKLHTLYLYDNHLRGDVPALPFDQYRYCGIGTSKKTGTGNLFCTPLPKGALACNREGPVKTTGACLA